MTERQPQYDAFISHSSEDREEVEELIETLTSRGVRCFDPEHDFKLGHYVIENMEDGIDVCKKFITFITQNYLKSRWCKKERLIAEEIEVTKKQNVIIDILVGVDKAILPKWMKRTTYIDINSKDFLKRLLKALGVSKPEERVDKTYEDLLQENMSLKEENTRLNNKYKREKLAWEREKQSLSSLAKEKQALLAKNQSLASKVQHLESAAQTMNKDLDFLKSENHRLMQRLNRENALTHESNSKQQKLEDPQCKTTVMDIDVPKFDIPVHWKPMSPEERFREVWLKWGSKEWREVVEMVRRTAGRMDGCVDDIWRIQNPKSYRDYQRKKWELSQHQGQDRTNEYTLYYGTTGWGECMEIVEHGFQKRILKGCESNPSGNGICFKSSFKDASQDAREIKAGLWSHKSIIVAKVLSGRCAQDNLNMAMQTSEQGDIHDKDNFDAPSHCRVKEPSQAYPEYCIQCGLQCNSQI